MRITKNLKTLGALTGALALGTSAALTAAPLASAAPVTPSHATMASCQYSAPDQKSGVHVDATVNHAGKPVQSGSTVVLTDSHKVLHVTFKNTGDQSISKLQWTIANFRNSQPVTFTFKLNTKLNGNHAIAPGETGSADLTIGGLPHGIDATTDITMKFGSDLLCSKPDTLELHGVHIVTPREN